MQNPFSFWNDVPPAQQRPKSRLRRVKQIDDAHCGPATLQMLLSHLDIHITQQDLAKAIKAEEYIQERGTRPDELAEAITLTAPQAQLWWKEKTSLEDLDTLINQYLYPVGLEWQALFYSSIEEELAETDGNPHQYDFGHYSVAISIDRENDEIVMVDPYFEFKEDNRFFSISWFERRWWDVNPIKDSFGHIHNKRDDRVSFVITMKGTSFPKMLGMKAL